ncbi:glycosyltransferase [Candidatus Kapabacteria bacterium]|nr:glycosyltransferase [Candidatus Kapabacteria bacterium]
MKIAYLSTFYPYRGGIAQFNAALFRAFERLGNEVRAFNFTRQYPDFIFPGSTQFVTEKDYADKIPNLRVLDTVNPVSYIKTAKKIKEFSPELVVSKFWLPFFGPSLGKVLKSTKRYASNVSIIDNAIPHEKRPLDRVLSKYYFNQNHKFITMSKSVNNDLLTLIPKAESYIHPHPLYNHFPKKIDKISARKKLGLTNQDKVLLFFGFIRDYKGLDVLLESLVSMPDYKLIIAGEIYGDFKKYDDIIQKHNLEKQIVKMVRYIDDDEVPLLFSAADVAMLTYKSATQSGILGIAYHYNLPVIATNTGGMKEMIEPYNTGIVIESANQKLIQEACFKFFKSDDNYFAKIQDFKEIASWDNLAKFIIKKIK